MHYGQKYKTVPLIYRRLHKSPSNPNGIINPNTGCGPKLTQITIEKRYLLSYIHHSVICSQAIEATNHWMATTCTAGEILPSLNTEVVLEHRATRVNPENALPQEASQTQEVGATSSSSVQPLEGSN